MYSHNNMGYLNNVKTILSWHLLKIEVDRTKNKQIKRLPKPKEFPSACMRHIRSLLQDFFKHPLILGNCIKDKGSNTWNINLNAVPQPHINEKLDLGPRQLMLKDLTEEPFCNIVSLTSEQEAVLQTYKDVKLKYKDFLDNSEYSDDFRRIIKIDDSFVFMQFRLVGGDFFRLYKLLKVFKDTFFEFIYAYIDAIAVGRNILDQLLEYDRKKDEEKRQRDIELFKVHTEHFKEWSNTLLSAIQSSGDPFKILDENNSLLSLNAEEINWSELFRNYKGYFDILEKEAVDTLQLHKDLDTIASEDKSIPIYNVEEMRQNATSEEMDGIRSGDSDALHKVAMKMLNRKSYM